MPDPFVGRKFPVHVVRSRTRGRTIAQLLRGDLPGDFQHMGRARLVNLASGFAPPEAMGADERVLFHKVILPERSLSLSRVFARHLRGRGSQWSAVR